MDIDDEVYDYIKRMEDKDSREIKESLKGELGGGEKKLLKCFWKLLC